MAAVEPGVEVSAAGRLVIRPQASYTTPVAVPVDNIRSALSYASDTDDV